RLGPADPRPGRVVSTAITGAVGLLLFVGAVLPVPDRYTAADASHDTGARRWVDAVLPQLGPDPVVLSWWSYSTPLWYARWAEGKPPDMTIIDARDVLDDDLGDTRDLIDRYLDEGRNVYLIRLDRDLPQYQQRFELSELPDIPGGT